MSKHTSSPLKSLEYDSAYENMLTRASRGFAADDQLMGMVRSRRTRHFGAGRNIINEETVDTTGRTASALMLIERDDVRLGNIDAHTTQVAEFSKANVASMAKMMFENLHQITEATGNVLDAKGERLSIDMLIDLIEKTEWRFDDDGNVVRDGQAFVVHPDLAPRLRELEETQEHRDRMEELRTTKLAEWNASRRCRRIGKESK